MISTKKTQYAMQVNQYIFIVELWKKVSRIYPQTSFRRNENRYDTLRKRICVDSVLIGYFNVIYVYYTTTNGRKKIRIVSCYVNINILV